MQNLPLAKLAVLITACIFHAPPALAQAYPAKPVRIVTSGVGGSNDVVARVIALGLTGSLGQSVMVDNRGGPSGTVVAGQIVATAPPDGHTLLSFASSFWLLPYLQADAPFDPIRDFSPITLAITAPSILVVHPSLPVHSVRQLVALAKSQPGKLNYASTATGSPNHLSAELFKSMTGVNIVRVPYKGASQSLNDLINGRIELAFPSATTVAPHMSTGRLRGLAVTSAQPSVYFPKLPTIAAAGIPDYDSVLMIGMFAPAQTPGAIINRLNSETVKVLHRPEVKERLATLGVEVAGSSPQAFAVAIKAEMARMSKVIREAGIRGDGT